MWEISRLAKDPLASEGGLFHGVRWSCSVKHWSFNTKDTVKKNLFYHNTVCDSFHGLFANPHHSWRINISTEEKGRLPDFSYSTQEHSFFFCKKHLLYPIFQIKYPNYEQHQTLILVTFPSISQRTLYAGMIQSVQGTRNVYFLARTPCWLDTLQNFGRNGIWLKYIS